MLTLEYIARWYAIEVKRMKRMNGNPPKEYTMWWIR